MDPSQKIDLYDKYIFLQLIIFNRALEYKSNIVGQGFISQPKDEFHLNICVVGEIVEAQGFEGDNLFIQWELKLPNQWSIDNSELLDFDESDFANVELDEWNRLSSVTQTTK